MQYALVNNIKSLAEKGKTGFCIGCSQEVIAKCGRIKVHHWAHKRADCDTWSEPETQWHREWKNQFPESYREVVFHDADTNQYHRADIHTKDGVTIEFQNSPISTEELKSREHFYKKLIWVVNALPFKDNFTLSRKIPNPEDPLLNNFEMHGYNYYNKAEIAEGHPLIVLKAYATHDPELKDLKVSDTHYTFSWPRERKVWFTSDALVFLDFGDDSLYWLRERKQVFAPFWYIQIVKKSNFINKYAASPGRL